MENFQLINYIESNLSSATCAKSNLSVKCQKDKKNLQLLIRDELEKLFYLSTRLWVSCVIGNRISK